MSRGSFVRLLQLATGMVVIVLVALLLVGRARFIDRHEQFRAEWQPRLARLLGVEQAGDAIAARLAAFEKALANLLFAPTATPETEARQIVQRLAQQQPGATIVALQTAVVPTSPELPELLRVRAVVTLTGEYAALHAWHRALLAHRPLLIVESAQWLREGGNEQFRDHQKMRLTVQLVLPFAVATDVQAVALSRSSR